LIWEERGIQYIHGTDREFSSMELSSFNKIG
jgi:hypothetical protein